MTTAEVVEHPEEKVGGLCFHEAKVRIHSPRVHSVLPSITPAALTPRCWSRLFSLTGPQILMFWHNYLAPHKEAQLMHP